MPRFMMIYKGQATDVADMTPEQGADVLAKWRVWIGNVGSSLSDIGTPFGPGVSLVDDGSTGTPLSLTGYSIVEAPNLDAARALADGHPYLSEGLGDFAVEIYELMPVPFES
jgi:YCII-related domain